MLQKSAEFITHVLFPWDDAWKVGTYRDNSHEELPGIWAFFKSQYVACPIVSMRVASAGHTTHMVFQDNVLKIVMTTADGTPHESFNVTSSTITHFKHYSACSFKKVWVRYYMVGKGFAWKCTHNENPTSPIHLNENCIPTTGRQLMDELSHQVTRRTYSHNPNVAATARALAAIITAVEWKVELSVEEVGMIEANYYKLHDVYWHTSNPYPAQIEEVLLILQNVVQEPRTAGIPLIKRFNDYMDRWRTAGNR